MKAFNLLSTAFITIFIVIVTNNCYRHLLQQLLYVKPAVVQYGNKMQDCLMLHITLHRPLPYSLFFPSQ